MGLFTKLEKGPEVLQIHRSHGVWRGCEHVILIDLSVKYCPIDGLRVQGVRSRARQLSSRESSRRSSCTYSKLKVPSTMFDYTQIVERFLSATPGVNHELCQSRQSHLHHQVSSKLKNRSSVCKDVVLVVSNHTLCSGDS